MSVQTGIGISPDVLRIGVMMRIVGGAGAGAFVLSMTGGAGGSGIGSIAILTTASGSARKASAARRH